MNQVSPCGGKSSETKEDEAAGPENQTLQRVRGERRDASTRLAEMVKGGGAETNGLRLLSGYCWPECLILPKLTKTQACSWDQLVACFSLQLTRDLDKVKGQRSSQKKLCRPKMTQF